MGLYIGVGKDSNLYTKKTLNDNWQLVPNSGGAVAVTIMPDGTILGVGKDSNVYIRSTLNSNWELIPNGGEVKSIAIMPDGTILGAGKDSNLYIRATFNDHWTQVDKSGYVNSIAIMLDGTILGVGLDSNLYTRKTLKANWQLVSNSGGVVAVTIMPDGTILGVGKDSNLYTRATLKDNWKSVPNSGGIVDVAFLDKINLIEFSNIKLLEKDFEPGEQAQLQFKVTNISELCYISNLKITEINGTYKNKSTNITLVSPPTMSTDNLQPNQTMEITLTLRSEECTHLGYYTIIPTLSYSISIISNVCKQRTPLSYQSEFKITSAQEVKV